MARTRLSLSARLSALCAALLALMAAALLYLTARIGESGDVVAAQAALIEQQSALVRRQNRLIAEQVRAGDEQLRLAREQARLSRRQRSLAAGQRELMAAQADTLGRMWLALEVSKAFYQLRYWLTDYALTWRAESATRAEELRRLVGWGLERLGEGELDSAEGDGLAAAVREYLHRMSEAGNAFLANRDARGRRLLAASRPIGDRIQARLDALLADAEASVTLAGTRTLGAARELGENADRTEATSARMESTVRGAGALGRAVRDAGALVTGASDALRRSAGQVLGQSERVREVALAIFLVATLVGAGLSAVFGRAIVGPLRRLAQTMSAIADGSLGLDQRLPAHGAGELARVAGAFNRMLESLRETTVSTAHLDDVVQSMSETLAVIDGDGTIRSVNRALLERLDYERERLVGRPLREILGDPWLQHRIVSAVGGEGVLAGVETSYVRRDGGEIPVLFSAARLQTSPGHGPAFVCVAQDITERKAAERAVRESEARFRDFVASASDWYWEMDEELRFTYFSPRFRAVTGIREDALIGRRPHDLEPPGMDPGTWRAHLADLAARRAFRGLVCPCRRPSGEVMWISTSGTPVFVDGVFRGYRGTGSDVTGGERARQELVRAKEVSEAAAAAKSRFLANVSHEIRTPMNGVLGMLELLRDGGLPPARAELADAAVRSASGLLALLDDLLDLSRIESGRLELERVEFDPGTAAEDVCELLYEEAYAKGVGLACTVGTQVPAAVKGDPVRFRQILTNLVANAVKFTDRGEVLVRLAWSGDAPHPARLRVAVSDTGIGVAPEHRERVFEAFTQADDSATRRFRGTGLGLSISRQLVERMGGRIGLDARPGGGSEFWFELPLEPGRAPGPVSGHGDPAGRVLVAGPDRPTRRAIARQLAAIGVEAMDAGGLEAPGARLDAGAVRAVIVDLARSHDDALALIRGLAAGGRAAGSSPPVVAVTAFGRKTEAARARAAGAHAVLTRPVRRAALRGAILAAGDGAAARAAGGAAERGRGAGDPDPARARVLVVEDNPINQKVAVGLLKRIGCRTGVADNGQRALEALARERFDLVLMDCQMPVLDGYEATLRLRGADGPHRDVPVVALTANAMPDEVRRCLACGMNGHLAKPVTLQALRTVVERWTGPAGTRGDGPRGAAAFVEGPAGQALDLAVTEALVGALGDDALEVVGLYLAGLEPAVESLRAALRTGDEDRVANLAHSLKGGSVNVGAVRVAGLCDAIAASVASGGRAHAERILETLIEEAQRVRRGLERWRGDRASPAGREVG